MSKSSETRASDWRDAVLSGIFQALSATWRGDPVAVQAWLGAAMGAARLHEIAQQQEDQEHERGPVKPGSGADA